MNRKVHLIGVGNRNNDINLLSETATAMHSIPARFSSSVMVSGDQLLNPRAIINFSHLLKLGLINSKLVLD